MIADGLGARARMRKTASTLPRLSWMTMLRYLVLTAAAIVIVFPFLWMVFASFKPAEDIFTIDFRLLPTHWQWENYIQAWHKAPFGRFYLNSFLCAAISIAAQVITCSLAGYAFAKIRFKGRGLIFTLMLSSMMIPGEATIIPNFLLVTKLHMINTYAGLTVTSLTSVFGIFLLRQMYMTIPDDLIDAAKMDGCSELRTFATIIFPCTTSGVITISIFGFIDAWNAYMWPLTVTNSVSMRTLEIGLSYMVNPDVGPEWPLIMAASTMIILPVIVLFIWFQQYFVDGMAQSGLK